jgi:acetyl esterase/lipase
MAISKVMRAVLKALSYPDIDVKKNYSIERMLVDATNYSIRKSSYITWDHVVSSGDHEIPVRIFFSSKQGPHEVLLFFHGGGWVTGNIDSYDDVCATLAEKTNHTVVSVDYSLAPEHRFPAGLEDCYCVARELYLKPSLFNVKANQITMIGDSAGGNLAAAVSLAARDRGEFMPARQILIYPSTFNDHSEQSPFPSVRENGTGYLLTSKRICDYMELYQSGEEDLQNPYFAPLLATDFSHQPKTLIITAEYDPLRDEGEEYGQKLKESGTAVEIHRISDAMHGFFSLPFLFPQVKESYQIINHFLSEDKQ